MGQEISISRSRRNSLRSFSIKSLRTSRSNSRPSYAFRINENGNSVYQLNINTASEEQLMTLNGINREIAGNILEHRKIIGRFKKVEDLALVKGIGANKMQELRSEISVSNKKLHSHVPSSRAPSYDSLNSHESRSTCKSNKLLNINRATIFELQNIDGITQETAAAIIHYRSKKGNFRKLEDLLKVKGVNKMLLFHICIHLTVENPDNPAENGEIQQKILTSSHTMPDCIAKSSSYNLPMLNGVPNIVEDIFELLSIYSPRPSFEEFNFKNGEAPAVRIGSWNLTELTIEKASNLGVKEVICCTILESGISILALQDVANVTALQIICEELNNPKLQKVKEWSYQQHYWNFCMLDEVTSKLGYMYDSQSVFEIKLDSLLRGRYSKDDECEALIAHFTIDNVILKLANILIKKCPNLTDICERMKYLTSVDDPLLVFIDLSKAEEVQLPNSHLKTLNLPNVNFYENKNRKKQNTSNILFNWRADKQRTGLSGVIRQGLTHLAIPNGWTWGGAVSHFCPIWIELFVNPLADSS